MRLTIMAERYGRERERVRVSEKNVCKMLSLSFSLCFQVTHFESWCGGLPHYNFANNPLKYKFRYLAIVLFVFE